MAQKVQVLLTCDLEETEKRASETVEFGFAVGLVDSGCDRSGRGCSLVWGER